MVNRAENRPRGATAEAIVCCAISASQSLERSRVARRNLRKRDQIAAGRLANCDSTTAPACGRQQRRHCCGWSPSQACRRSTTCFVRDDAWTAGQAFTPALRQMPGSSSRVPVETPAYPTGRLRRHHRRQRELHFIDPRTPNAVGELNTTVPPPRFRNSITPVIGKMTLTRGMDGDRNC